MVWDEFDPQNGRSLDDESVLFALHFTLIGNAGDTGVIRLSDDPTPFKRLRAVVRISTKPPSGLRSASSMSSPFQGTSPWWEMRAVYRSQE